MDKTGVVAGSVAVPMYVYTNDKATHMLNTITFRNMEIGDEMLRIAPDGFYVRGKKILQDDNEAREVYEAFVSWLRKVEHWCEAK